jgi:hypothetical protein
MGATLDEWDEPEDREVKDISDARMLDRCDIPDEELFPAAAAFIAGHDDAMATLWIFIERCAAELGEEPQPALPGPFAGKGREQRWQVPPGSGAPFG